jgi:hypothetical protein
MRATVSLSHAGFQACGDLQQHLVADLVAERVVDALEVIEIDHHHADRHRRPVRLGNGNFEPVLKQRAIGQLRQGIVLGEVADVLLLALGFGDVGDHADQALHRPVVVDDADRQRHGKLLAIAAQPGDLAAQTDDVAVAAALEVGDQAVVPGAVAFRHQHGDVATDHLAGGEAEHALGGVVEAQHDALRIDRQDAFGAALDHRAMTGLGRAQRARHLLRQLAGTRLRARRGP